MYGFCACRLLSPFPTVSFVWSKIVRMTYRTKSGLLDLVTRVVRDHSSDLILLRVCPKDSDWSRRRCRLEDRPKDSLKDSYWSRQRCLLEDCPRILRRILIGRDESPSEIWSVLIVYWIVIKNKSSELTRLYWVGIRLNQFGMFEERFKLLSGWKQCGFKFETKGCLKTMNK